MSFRTWGGRRKGAGRKRVRPDQAVPHRARPTLVGRRYPVHITLRMNKHVWNLRSRRCFRVIERAFMASNERAAVKLVRYSVQGNHVHLIAESENERTLSRGVRALAIRIAKRMNRLMGRRGRLFADRYHEHILKTQLEVRRAISYLENNAQRHYRVCGVDPFFSTGNATSVVAPRTWLLRRAVLWRGHPRFDRSKNSLRNGQSA